jgi:hypothetical protein
VNDLLTTLWNSVTNDPTVYMRALRDWLNNVAFERWMTTLGSVLALIGVALHFKLFMMAGSTRKFVGILLHMALVGAIIASQQWLRNEVKVLYQLLYDHAQWVIKQPSDEAASIISGISAGLGTLVVGSVGFVSGTLDAIGSGGITAIPTSPIAGALGSIKALIVVGQLLAGLFVAIYMAYYITLVACGVLLTLGVAVLPFLAGLSLIEGMGGLKVLVHNVRSMVTGVFTMLLLPYIFRISLEIGWLAPGRKIVDIIERAVAGLLEKINELGLGFSNIGQTVNTIGGLAFSDDIRNSLLEAVWTALAVSVGGIVMIILGMMAGLYLIRRAEVIVAQVVGGIGSGLAGMVGNSEGRLTGIGAGFTSTLASGSANATMRVVAEAQSEGNGPRSRGGPMAG